MRIIADCYFIDEIKTTEGLRHIADFHFNVEINNQGACNIYAKLVLPCGNHETDTFIHVTASNVQLNVIHIWRFVFDDGMFSPRAGLSVEYEKLSWHSLSIFRPAKASKPAISWGMRPVCVCMLLADCFILCVCCVFSFNSVYYCLGVFLVYEECGRSACRESAQLRILSLKVLRNSRFLG